MTFKPILINSWMYALPIISINYTCLSHYWLLCIILYWYIIFYNNYGIDWLLSNEQFILYCTFVNY